MWDGKERRSGKDKRVVERRGKLSQTVSSTLGSTNQRKQVRRAADRQSVSQPVDSDFDENKKWREIRLKTVGKLAGKPENKRPNLRLVRDEEK
ncbi:MAG TPA: hypothetical protein VFC63_06650 [Blastocatellia bacterium]|nr:hypothetical protein [Blastocatellia bacterium]